MNDSYFKTVQEFREIMPARKLIANAMKELLPTKGNRFGFFFSLFISVNFAVIVGCSEDTVLFLSKVADTLLNAQLAIFGCIFAVYSILLAFLGDGYMKRLAKIEVEGKTSMLKQSTVYYESVLFLYFVNIALSGIVVLETNCIDPSYRLTNSIYVDTGLTIVLLLIYFFFSFRVFYELKSTIYNTIVLFRASIAYRFMDFAVEERNENGKNDEKEDE